MAKERIFRIFFFAYALAQFGFPGFRRSFLNRATSEDENRFSLGVTFQGWSWPSITMRRTADGVTPSSLATSVEVKV
jgi:hypothetical protein